MPHSTDSEPSWTTRHAQSLRRERVRPGRFALKQERLHAPLEGVGRLGRQPAAAMPNGTGRPPPAARRLDGCSRRQDAASPCLLPRVEAEGNSLSTSPTPGAKWGLPPHRPYTAAGIAIGRERKNIIATVNFLKILKTTLQLLSTDTFMSINLYGDMCVYNTKTGLDEKFQ